MKDGVTGGFRNCIKREIIPQISNARCLLLLHLPHPPGADLLCVGCGLWICSSVYLLAITAEGVEVVRWGDRHHYVYLHHWTSGELAAHCEVCYSLLAALDRHLAIDPSLNNY